jgi:lipopolysaccharide biosynthesis glycosyltransferase
MATIAVSQSFDASTLASKRVVTGATDDRMVYGLLVWASSLAHTASDPFHLVVAYFKGTLSGDNVTLIGGVLDQLGLEHSFLELTLDDRFITQGHISPTTFTKFLIADAIATPHLWIDVDTVAQPGWDELFGFVTNPPTPTDLVVAERGDRNTSLSTTPGFVPSDLPFNAGVLGWPATPRRDWAAELSKVRDVPTVEQFVFNVLYSPSCLKVSESFNTLTYRIDSLRNTSIPHIVHYAGAHKPWHLPRRFARMCQQHECPWSLWFDAEATFLKKLQGSPWFTAVSHLASTTLSSSGVRWQRDHSGVLLLRLLKALGPLGWGVVLLAKPFAKWIPRGTHPLH